MQCNYFKESGARCEAAALKGGGFCFSHEPQAKEAHHEASVKGGSTPKKSNLDLPPVSIKTVHDIVTVLEDTVNLVRSGEMPTNTANCICYISGVILKAIQVSDIEGRLEVVEGILGAKKSEIIKYD